MSEKLTAQEIQDSINELDYCISMSRHEAMKYKNSHNARRRWSSKIEIEHGMQKVYDLMNQAMKDLETVNGGFSNGFDSSEYQRGLREGYETAKQELEKNEALDASKRRVSDDV